ncbi:PLP-dependent lyase/thiolase [Ilumatobacter nonamiensis]|uniref:PLP-dependent lyase/thiolase n=1 Tax=Ilumatobacter nonamiensis TaxID=467093 RepID=UPI00130DC268|nr:PLP-dependent lyase/thiolase [Ilumatobacter nonamiensis]
MTDRHHVLQADVATERPAPAMNVAGHPFVENDSRLAWAATASALGMTDDARQALVRELDDAVRSVDGTGFVVTPFTRCPVVSDELGFSADGGVWVKDETGGVGGSQKARHLFTILLHLRAMELLGHLPERPRLAIASCGNAALAAATLARAARWPIDVFVPTWMSDGFGDRLDSLGATIHRCPRRDDDPPGDPAMLRFREAVAGGSVPFTVQGPENALCLDGGRTIGWEIGAQMVDPAGPGALDAIFVQVGGGALAACLGSALGESVPMCAVQAEGCAPLDRGLRRATGVDDPAQAWGRIMTPWTDPTSLADGILDDETYDWLGVLDAVNASGGSSIVASEANIVAAHELARRSGLDVSPTGSAGLAGLLEVQSAPTPGFDASSNVAVVMSGVER